ncbi:MAG: glycosyltransferase family 2 protein [Phycisphaerales bacterium]|nr:glycosyltransferase family 2 protein [Phycisphaerales bacterium]
MPANGRVLIGIPVYNEEETVSRVIEEVGRVAHASCADVLVVDDGSTDGTSQALVGQPVHVIRSPENRGYGWAIRHMLSWAAQHSFEWLITIDCDEQHEPASIPVFLEAIAEDDSDVVSGSRYLESRPENDAPPADRRRINQLMTHELNRCLGLRITDAFCGFKAYRVAACQKLELDRDGYDIPMQFWVEVAEAKLRIREIPVKLLYPDENRTFGGELDDFSIRLAHYRSAVTEQLARRGKAPCPKMDAVVSSS